MRKIIAEQLAFLEQQRQEARALIRKKLEKRRLQNSKRRAEIKSGAKVGQATRYERADSKFLKTKLRSM